MLVVPFTVLAVVTWWHNFVVECEARNYAYGVRLRNGGNDNTNENVWFRLCLGASPCTSWVSHTLPKYGSDGWNEWTDSLEDIGQADTIVIGQCLYLYLFAIFVVLYVSCLSVLHIRIIV